MVAVGDDELFVGHGGEEEIDEVGVGEFPELMDYAVFVGDGEVGGVVVEAIGECAFKDEFFGGEGRV